MGIDKKCRFGGNCKRCHRGIYKKSKGSNRQVDSSFSQLLSASCCKGKFKFGINPNTFSADSELWICGKAAYYLMPIFLSTQRIRKTSDPEAEWQQSNNLTDVQGSLLHMFLWIRYFRYQRLCFFLVLPPMQSLKSKRVYQLTVTLFEQLGVSVPASQTW